MCAADAFLCFEKRLAHESFVNCHRRSSLDILRPAFNGKLGRMKLMRSPASPRLRGAFHELFCCDYSDRSLMEISIL